MVLADQGGVTDFFAVGTMGRNEGCWMWGFQLSAEERLLAPPRTKLLLPRPPSDKDHASRLLP